MKEKVLWELMANLRGEASLSLDATVELALKLLVWARLSGDQTADPTRPGRVRDLLAISGHDPRLLPLAFPDDPRLERLDSKKLQPTISLLLRLREQGILDAFDPADAIAALFPERTGLLELPAELAELLVGLSGMSATDTVYTPWDAFGQLAFRCARQAPLVYLETPEVSAVPALISLLSVKPFEVHFADPIREPSAVEAGQLRKFDISVAFPPIMIRYDIKDIERDWFNRFPDRTTASGVLAVRHLLAQTDRRVVMAVQNSLLFSVGAEQKLRQDLLKGGQVQAVIAMPSGLLPTTNVAFTVLVLAPTGGHQQVRFINADASRFRQPVSKAKTTLTDLPALIDEIHRTGESAESISVDVRDVLANESHLQVDRYVLPEVKKRVRALLANTPKVALGDLVTTIRPVKMPLEAEDALEAKEVGAADLPARGYITAPSRVITVSGSSGNRSQQQFLKPYDIVLIIKGSVGKVGIVPPDVPPAGKDGWLAGGSSIVLRMLDFHRLDPRTLFMELRSPLGQEILSGIVSGATIPLIQLRELNRLELPLPPPETARRAQEAFEQEVAIQREIDALQKRQAEISADLWAL